MVFLEKILDNQFFHIFVTLLAAAAGGILFYKLKIPAGALIGSMLFVMLLSVLWGKKCDP